MAKEPRRKQSIEELKVEIARSRDRFTRDLRELPARNRYPAEDQKIIPAADRSLDCGGAGSGNTSDFAAGSSQNHEGGAENSALDENPSARFWKLVLLWAR